MSRRLHRAAGSHRVRMTGQYLADSVVWALAIFTAAHLRFLDLNTHPANQGLLFGWLVVTVIQGLVGLQVHLYRGRYLYGSFDEVRGVVVTVGLAGFTLMLASALIGPPRPVPLSAVAVAMAFALVGMLGVRYALRIWRDRRKRPTDAVPALVYGAGDAGAQLVTNMLRDLNSHYLPVGILDDAPHKQRLVISGVPVLGTGNDMADAVADTGAQVVIVAITGVTASTMRRVIKNADAAGVSVKVLPPLSEIVHGEVQVADIRDIDLEDLLGRHEIDISVEDIAGYLSGRTVLVTGAGGSIGSELSKQIHRFGPAKLYLLDRDESALHAVELLLYGRALLTHDTSVLADIRDAVRMREVFEEIRPDVVFHAAALKHLPVLERFPEEAVKSNVWGTWNVLEAAVASGVSRFVNISTDKAADPISVLGYSKRVAERLTSWVAAEEDRDYLSVRFGNVLGSRGSVVTTFQDQISRGAPITVTDPRVTRYFMTVAEACQLVIQAAARGHRGDTLVLDMGEPVSIEELARTLAAHAGRPAVIAYSGLRPGEKLHEALVGVDEVQRPGGHPLVTAVDVPPLSPSAVLAVGAGGDFREALLRLAGWPTDGSELLPEDLSAYESTRAPQAGENDTRG